MWPAIYTGLNHFILIVFGNKVKVDYNSNAPTPTPNHTPMVRSTSHTLMMQLYNTAAFLGFRLKHNLLHKTYLAVNH